MPVTHRSDFKQAFSTLQRLRQEAEADLQVPTFSKELARFMVDSFIPCESYDGDEPSTDRRG